MEIYVNSRGQRVSGLGQPYIDQQESWRNVRLYNPNGAPPSEGLYSPTESASAYGQRYGDVETPRNRGQKPEPGCGPHRHLGADACQSFQTGFNRELSLRPRPPIHGRGC